jgi:hypothetical protein
MNLTRVWLSGLAAMLAWVPSAGTMLAWSSQERPEPPAPPSKTPLVLVTISKETTYITQPLRKDGYVDYLAALNQRCSKGVTPENNAAVPFLNAMWPADISPRHRGEYCQMLGIRPPPEKGGYYVALHEYAKVLKAAESPAAEARKEGRDILGEQFTQATRRPWSKKEFPILAGWLAANEGPLALVVAASRRPRRYDPLISGDGSVIAVLLPILQRYRDAARALTARATLRVQAGKVDEAWEDLLACHRLARLAGQGPLSVEALVAITVDGMACAGDRALLEYARLDPAQIGRIRADLHKLRPVPRMVDKIDVAERFMYLDCVRTVAQGGLSSVSGLTGGEPKTVIASLRDAAASNAVDWDLILRMGNSWYDGAADALRKPTRGERQAAAGKIAKEIDRQMKEARDWKSLALDTILDRRGGVSRRVGLALIAVVSPATGAAGEAEDRGTMLFGVTRLGFALAAYRADHGACPAKLADLVPKYAAEVPKDIFAAADLHYKLEGSGCLVYSVGTNGKDDGGRGYADRKEGEDWDDLAVRLPAAGK